MNQDVDIVTKCQEESMKNKISTDAQFMQLALKEAKKAFEEDEIPVGAVLVIDDKVVARAHNQRQKHHDVFGHAESIVIKKATKKLNTWILENATLYVTLEPCLMCSGAIIQARIKRVVYATPEPKFGCAESILKVFDIVQFNHQVELSSGVLKEEASELLKSYFRQKRKNKG